MVNFDYLVKGLSALSRAHQVNTMTGHLGAAVISGYFIAEQHPDLDPSVYEGIEGELEQIIRGESVFSPAPKAAISVADLFAAVPQQPADEGLIDGIAEALAENIDQTRQSGHNVIFAAIAIRALKDHPEFSTPAVTDGLRTLILGFNGETPGNGYYGKEKGRIDGRRVELADDDGPASYVDLVDMARTVVGELIVHGSQRRQGFGGLWHVINHAAALAELANYGYRELAVRGLPAHRQHLRLWQTLPDVTDELGPETATAHDPRTAAFWTSGELRHDRARLTHRVKTLYGYDTLVALVDNEDRRNEGNDKLRYLM